MSRQPVQTCYKEGKKKYLIIQKTFSYMPSSIYSIINIILPEFGKKKILKINVMKFNKNSIQEEFSLNLHNKQ